MSKRDKMNILKDKLVNLKESPLYAERVVNNVLPVMGQGSLKANIVFIGEAPGKNEAMKGRPFCGVSGKILDELLLSIGLAREDVYITNIVKDRPTDNRDPKPEEIDLYAPFLDGEIEIIKPSVLATLGRFSTAYIMNRYGLSEQIDTISNLHGKSFKTKIGKSTCHVVPLYHPAVAVYNRKKLPELKDDFAILKGFL